MIFSHIRSDCELFGLLDDDIDREKDFKTVISRFSLTCKRWSLTLRPYLFRRIALKAREDFPFLLSIVRSPLSGWLAGCLACIEIIVAKMGPHRPRFSSTFWRDLRENFPATKTLWFEGEHGKHPAALWRERISLRTFTHIQTVYIGHIYFPSYSSLLRLLNSFSSLERVLIALVEWGTDGSEVRGLSQTASLPVFSNVRFLACERCTDNRCLAWTYSLACARLRRLDQAHSIPPTARTVMGLVDKAFEDDSTLTMVKVHDTPGELLNFGFWAIIALTAPQKSMLFVSQLLTLTMNRCLALRL